jgi:hypothetical protein
MKASTLEPRSDDCFPSIHSRRLLFLLVNVAGESQILDPAGADLIGINVPFGEFLNAGSFETTYMDDKIRVSRSKVGIVDQLRVFLRSDLDFDGTTTPTTTATAETESKIEIEQVNEAEIAHDDTEDDVSPSDDIEDDISPSDY